MVGGGQGALSAPCTAWVARLDGHWEVVAGAWPRPERAQASGEELGLAADRIYPDFATMASAEAAREDGIDAVSIVTPNHVHFPAAKAFLEAGIPVICDKPLTSNGEDAAALAALVAQTGTPFVLTHNYTGYPMIRQARAMVEAGDLGELRLVHVEYIQDWLSEDLESEGDEAGRVAHRPQAVGRGRRHRRYRLARLQSGGLHHPGAG